jgi:hypothetical protein
MKLTPFAQANAHRLCWRQLSANPSAICLLEANPDRIDWKMLSLNCAASHLLTANLHRITWSLAARNPTMTHVVQRNPTRIDYGELHVNPSPAAFRMLTAYWKAGNSTCWCSLSSNAGVDAHAHLMANKRHIFPACSSDNPAASLAMGDVSLGILSGNPAAMDLLEANPRMVDWEEISGNRAIFTYDYAAMASSRGDLRRCLLSHVMHPRNALRLQGLGLVA